MAGTQYRGSEIKGVDQFLEDAEGLDSEREKEIANILVTDMTLIWFQIMTG